ncbi:DNA repair protein RecO [Halochromatium sp.]
MSLQTLKRGFVLHRRDYRNTSLLLELFVAEDGRLPCIAKGAKSAARGRSALAALLQPFQPLWLSWVGRGEVKTLTRAEAAGPSIALSAERLYCGFYLNELLLRLVDREDPQEALFVFYQQALADLATESVDQVLRRFELRLLEELGYALDLRLDRQGKPIDRGRYYRYVPSEGLDPVPETGASQKQATALAEQACLEGGVSEPSAVGARAGAPSSAAVAADQEVLISGVTLERLATGAVLQRTDTQSARALMRAALAPHLGPKPLRSRELFRRRPS